MSYLPFIMVYMTLAPPTIEPVEQARLLLREAASIIETLSVPNALLTLATSRSVLDAAETRLLGRQINDGIGVHQTRQLIKEATGEGSQGTAQAARRAAGVWPAKPSSWPLCLETVAV